MEDLLALGTLRVLGGLAMLCRSRRFGTLTACQVYLRPPRKLEPPRLRAFGCELPVATPPRLASLCVRNASVVEAGLKGVAPGARRGNALGNFQQQRRQRLEALVELAVLGGARGSPDMSSFYIRSEIEATAAYVGVAFRQCRPRGFIPPKELDRRGG